MEDVNIKRVQVKWEDSAFETGQHTVEEIKQMTPVVMFSVGFLATEANGCVYLAHNMCDDVFRNIEIIPSKCVIRITSLCDALDELG
jgi:hypothetical protein